MSDDPKVTPKTEPKVELAKIDFPRVALLLQVVKDGASHSALYGSIVGEAGLELAAINADVKTFADERTRAKLAADVEAKAKEDAKQIELRAKQEQSLKAAPAPEPKSIPITPAADDNGSAGRRI